MSVNAHPELPEFDYVKPASLAEASQFLSNHIGQARILLGGTDIFVRMRDGHWKDHYLVDIKGLDGTNEITFNPTQGLIIGAAVNMNKVIASDVVQKHYPLLAEAARSVASYQLRTRATIVGNICNASPAGDTIGAAMLYEGVLKVHGLSGWRSEPLSTLFLGPGKTTLKPGDVVTAIEFPLPPTGATGTYIKLGRNQLSDLSIIGVAALGYPDKTTASGYRFRIALASVAPVPLRPVKAEALLAEKPVDEASLKEAAKLTMDASSPIDDVRSSASYRKEMSRNMTYKALQEVWGKLNA